MDQTLRGYPLGCVCRRLLSEYEFRHGPSSQECKIVGAAIIKHKLCLGDEETIEQIRENPYLQYFVGLKPSRHLPLHSLSISETRFSTGSTRRLSTG
ncbi:MAG: transposase [Deltaproteobacteria bacterium]|nr:transposase [Candidatus Anaeroferrophillus wilburensis]MBN2889001.1 transposase [Deltaproteobacteria bacterium]